jgi:hypothetical protein
MAFSWVDSFFSLAATERLGQAKQDRTAAGRRAPLLKLGLWDQVPG